MNTIDLLGRITAWKLSNYGVLSGPSFHVFSPNTGKYGPEKTLYLDTFHAVDLTLHSHFIKHISPYDPLELVLRCL